MPQQTTAQARVIDPILSGVARGYRSNASPVADVLFPNVSVGQRGGRVISFGPDDFKLYSTARAPGANTKRVQFGYAGVPFALVDYSLEGAVPIELMQEGQAVPNLNQGQIAIARVRNIQALEREKQCADLALTAATYAASNKVTLSGTDQWSDAAGGDRRGRQSAATETAPEGSTLSRAAPPPRCRPSCAASITRSVALPRRCSCPATTTGAAWGSSVRPRARSSRRCARRSTSRWSA